MGGIRLSRHELRWVLEQAGADRWPYPLRAPAWEADTEAEITRHRARVEAGLRERGLLEPGPARVLLRAGELVAGWRVAVDLVRRDPVAPRAAVVLGDAVDAVTLVSPEHADAPVQLEPAPADRMPEALLGLVPPTPAGVGGPWPVAEPSGPEPVPTTDRAASVRLVVEELIATARATSEVGVATRADVEDRPVRAAAHVAWLDGPRGRFAVRYPTAGSSRTAVLVGVNDQQLLGDIHTVLGEAVVSTSRPEMVGPRTSGRSTA